MVDIVSHANIAAENDAFRMRSESSSSAVSTPDKIANSPKNNQNENTTAGGISADVRLEISKLKNISGYVYKLIDRKSGEVIRQWPTEDMIKMRQYLAEQQIQLIDRQA